MPWPTSTNGLAAQISDGSAIRFPLVSKSEHKSCSPGSPLRPIAAIPQRCVLQHERHQLPPRINTELRKRPLRIGLDGRGLRSHRLRLSIGLEDSANLVADIKAALDETFA